MNTDTRHTRLLIGLGVVAAILLAKIFSIQILDDHYKADAEINSTVKEMILPTRGVIYDRNGSILVGNKVAYDILRDALNKMLDTSCSGAFEGQLLSFIEAQDGVERVDLLRTRQFGNRIYVDLEIAVKPDISLRDAHGIAERVHSAVEQEFPNVKHVMIHVNPGDD